MYSSYTASSFAKIYDIAGYYKINLLGVVSWAFEFEDQPWFHGFRDLATNGVDKPVLNVFRMFGMMSGTRVEAKSNAGIAWETVIETGVRGDKPDINAIATKKKNEATVMLWNYHDDDKTAADATVEVVLNGIAAKKVQISQYRIDKDNSNSYEVWKSMGSPQNPTTEQYTVLEKAGQLKTKGSPVMKKVRNGTLVVNTMLPRQGVELLVIRWK